MTQTTAPTPELIPSFSTVIAQRADPYRRQTRCIIEVDVIPKSQMIGEAMIPQGLARVEIPNSMLPLIEALVIDPMKEKLAIESHARLKAEWEEANPGNDKFLSPHSVASAYRAMFKHDMGALRYCKVIEDNRPAPLTEEETRAANVAASVTRSRGKSR